jgi:hypothetical protein
MNGSVSIYDLSISKDRLCIGNYIVVAPNDKFKEAIEVVSIDKGYIVGKKSDGTIDKFKYDDLRGLPLSEIVMQQKGWKYGGSVSFNAVLLKGPVSLRKEDDVLIPCYTCYVGDEVVAALRCVHEWQNLMKLVQGRSLVNEELTTIVNDNGLA